MHLSASSHTHLFTLCFNGWLSVFTNFCNTFPVRCWVRWHNNRHLLTYIKIALSISLGPPHHVTTIPHSCAHDTTHNCTSENDPHRSQKTEQTAKSHQNNWKQQFITYFHLVGMHTHKPSNTDSFLRPGIVHGVASLQATLIDSHVRQLSKLSCLICNTISM